MSELSPLPELLQLDRLDPLEALELTAAIRSWLHEQTEGQMVRARLAGHSWRRISGAAALNPTTTRRWVLSGLPEQVRVRL